MAVVAGRSTGSLGSMKFAAIYVLLAAMTAIGISSAGRMFDYWKLASDGVETMGTVVQPTCASHMSFRYKYSVGDRTFQAVGIHAAKPCPSLLPGDPVKVSYLPDDPGTSMIGDPHSALKNEIVSITMAALILPALAVWVLWRRYRHAA